MKTLVVNYHYCTSEAEEPYLARTAVSPATFSAQIASLAHASALPTDERAFDCLVTFDDGTKNNFRNAVPVLKRHGMPAILFVCSLPLMQKKLLNVTKIHLLQGKLGFDRFRSQVLAAVPAAEQMQARDPGCVDSRRLYRYDDEATRQFKLLLNVRLPYPTVTRVLNEIFEAELGSQAEAAERTYMSLADLRQCLLEGVAIGSHTHSHPMLSRLTPAEQEAEIGMAMEFLRDSLQLKDQSFAYPYGVDTAWTNETKECLARLGVSRAYTLGRRVYHPDRDRDALEIPRFDVNDVFDSGGAIKPGLS